MREKIVSAGGLLRRKKRDPAFAANIQEQLEAKGTANLSAKEKKIMALLTEPASPRKDRRLARMENHARAALDMDPSQGAVDWSKIDWTKWLGTVLSVLVKFLPLLLL